ncbi:hypothetical protein M5X00_21045 [Paenibacillus alvei]|uniref:Zinc ribbon domain-containing protein n=1 Tax=Paenibacillus alvei TaxID=44250 RepID=A0ABT4H4T1_PAEAL|nr:hypothetical protein [Paenibacillus alvei]EJW19312.1 hypothetical protein PAV_1c02840 [Paenibacillus alvei DSM 29]MCY7483694.1 hypothetical protein [Paenibacillus alvei]MCY9543224.1 hypothetical protein [Paenibacillus alvei]MCY9704817.1 hypothetical protein [Paenibacillus alvei]MCY9735904.1 hypothetical protein [Paenibacillus alvei]
MRARFGSILSFFGGLFLFAFGIGMIGIMLERSMFRVDFIGVCFFVFLIPGLILFRFGGKIKKKAKEREYFRQLGLNPPSMVLYSFMRFIGGCLILLYAVVCFSMIVNWTTQKDKLILAILFALLFFTPGVLLWWAASALEKKSQERFRMKYPEYFEQEPLPRDMPLNIETVERVEMVPEQPIRYAVAEAEVATSVSSIPPQLPKMITCSSCGAKNSVSPNSATKCEYCGSTVTYM